MAVNFRLMKITTFLPKNCCGKMGFAPKNVADPEKKLDMHVLNNTGLLANVPQ